MTPSKPLETGCSPVTSVPMKSYRTVFPMVPGIGDKHAALGVARDDVASGGMATADEVGRGRVLDHHAVRVGHSERAGDVGADIVALDEVIRRARVGDQDAVAGVAGDDVAGAGRRAAHDVGDRPADQVHAVLAVRQGLAPVTSVPI